MKLQDFLLSIIQVHVCFFTHPLYCKKETSCNKFLLNWYSILETIVVCLGFCLPWNCSVEGNSGFTEGLLLQVAAQDVPQVSPLQRGDTWLSSASWNQGWLCYLRSVGLLPVYSSCAQGMKPWNTDTLLFFGGMSLTRGKRIFCSQKALLNHCFP